MNRAAKRVGFTLMGMNGTASLAKRLAPAGVIGVDGMTIDEMIRVLEVVREQLGGNALVCAQRHDYDHEPPTSTQMTVNDIAADGDVTRIECSDYCAQRPRTLPAQCHPPTSSLMKKVTIEFANNKAAEHFLSWLCGQGEQDYWNWMACREEEEQGQITATGFDYWGGTNCGAEFGKHPVKTTCGRLDDDCGTLCDRGYSSRWREDKVIAVWCFGCNDKRELCEFNVTKRLNSHFMTTTIIKHYNALRDNDASTLDAYENAWCAIQDIELAVKHFRESVWPNVHAQVNAERLYKGMRVDCDDLTILAFAMCGRIRIQVERGDVWCSAQGTEESAEYGIGLHGIDATAAEAVQLWRDAIKAFRNGAKLVGMPSVGL
jgi:hypothetical protein